VILFAKEIESQVCTKALLREKLKKNETICETLNIDPGNSDHMESIRNKVRNIIKKNKKQTDST